MARRYLDQARQIAVSNQNLPKVVSFTLSLAALLKQMNRLPEAEKLGTQGLVLARQTDNWSLMGDAARTMASIRLTQNQPAQAETLLQQAVLSDERVGAPMSNRLHTGTPRPRARSAKRCARRRCALQASSNSSGGCARDGQFGKRFCRNQEQFQGLRTIGAGAHQAQPGRRGVRLHEALPLQDLARRAAGGLAQDRDKALQPFWIGRSRSMSALAPSKPNCKPNGQTRRAARQHQNRKPAKRHRFDARRVGQSVATKSRLSTRPTTSCFGQADATCRSQRGIPEDAAFIMYVPLKASESGEEQLYTFVVTRENLKIFTPNVKAADLWTRIRAVRRQIARREDTSFTRGLKGAAMTDIIGRGDPNDKTWGEPTKPDEPSLSDNLVALNEMLITPIQSEIASKKLLAFIPTELFYYLPMQALAKRDGDNLRFLIEDKEVVYLTNPDVMNVVQAPATDKASRGMVAFGDPVGANLPSAGVEARTIAQIFPGSTDFEGAQVTKASVTDAGNLNRRVVHFATHGILNPALPLNSYILLSPGQAAGDGQLTVGEVWNLPLQKVDLVTLSACNTALGERDPDGSELTTLAGAFSIAGANSVLASLWSVSDDSTKDLMVEFYRQLAGGKTKSEALRAAELSVMKMPEYRHPYFWAPFILMGDWR